MILKFKDSYDKFYIDPTSENYYSIEMHPVFYNEDVYYIIFSAYVPPKVDIVSTIEDIEIKKDERINSKLLETVIFPSVFNDIFDIAQMNLNEVSNHILEMYKNCFKEIFSDREINAINHLVDKNISQINIERSYKITSKEFSPKFLEPKELLIIFNLDKNKNEYIINHEIMFSLHDNHEEIRNILEETFRETMLSMGIRTSYQPIIEKRRYISVALRSEDDIVPISVNDKNFFKKLKNYNSLFLTNLLGKILKWK